jgi:integrase
MKPSSGQQANLVVLCRAGAGGNSYWDARWRYRLTADTPWKLIQRRLGLAWQEQDEAGEWRKRRGRCPDGWLDERAATVAAVAAMEAHSRELALTEKELRKAAEASVSVRELAAQWLDWLEHVRGAKPSTVADYAFLLREPDQPHLRGPGKSPGRIMAAFGDTRADAITTRDVGDFLQGLDRAGLTPRNVNKHRQILAAMFSYGCRPDSFNLASNPAAATDKRREDPPPALDYYEVEEVEALARACEAGDHQSARTILDPEELAARQAEGHQDAEAFRLLFYTGLRLGEVLTLRWEDVNLPDRLLLVRRGLSAGVETLPKGRRHRFVPLSAAAATALARLATRTDFIGPDDYVLVNRIGRRLDGSALRRRYKRGCIAAELRPVRLHGLRHAAGSLIARTSDPVFVRDFLGHAKLTTTDRYLSAKLRPEELERLDLAFMPSSHLASADQ